QLVDQAREQADKGLVGSMEGHAEMDMSVHRSGSVWQRMRSPEGFTATANYFVMDWAAIWRDIVGGLLIAGALAAWVPESFWKRLFFEHHSALAKFWGPIIGPLVAMVSFVCSIGNVPLAAVLWNGGISFGRRARIHLRRPDHPAHPRHIPALLRPQDGGVLARHLLCRDGAVRVLQSNSCFRRWALHRPN